MRINMPPKKAVKFPAVGLTAIPNEHSWDAQKTGLRPGLIHAVNVSQIDGAIECNLRGVFEGVEFNYWEYADYLKQKEK